MYPINMIYLSLPLAKTTVSTETDHVLIKHNTLILFNHNFIETMQIECKILGSLLHNVSRFLILVFNFSYIIKEEYIIYLKEGKTVEYKGCIKLNLAKMYFM